MHMDGARLAVRDLLRQNNNGPSALGHKIKASLGY